MAASTARQAATGRNGEFVFFGSGHSTRQLFIIDICKTRTAGVVDDLSVMERILTSHYRPTLPFNLLT
jgi:hypothetical protein